MVTHMSVKLRERPVVRKAMRTGVPQRLLPLAFQLCAALLGWLGAGAPLLGGLRPLGLCFAAAVPTPYAVCAAAGAAAGYAFALPLADAAPYLAGAAVVALLRGLAGTRRQNYAPMAPATAAGIVFCLIRSGLAVAGYAGLPGILSAAAEALLVLGLSYLLVGFFAVPRQGGMPQDAEERAALCFAFMALLACLTPYTVLGLSVARAAAALTVLAVAARGQEGAAAVTAVGAMAALCAADPANLYAGLGIAAGGLAAGLFTGSSRPVTALVFCGAGLVGVSCAPGNNAGLQLAVELCIAGAAYCLLPAGLFQRVPAAPPSAPFASRAALTTLSGRLEAVSGALCAVGDTVQAVCERLPPRRETTADLCDAVAERCCKACGKRLYCWVDCAGETYDAFNNLSPLIAMPDGVAAADLPPVLQRRWPDTCAAGQRHQCGRRRTGCAAGGTHTRRRGACRFVRTVQRPGRGSGRAGRAGVPDGCSGQAQGPPAGAIVLGDRPGAAGDHRCPGRFRPRDGHRMRAAPVLHGRRAEGHHR